MGVKLILLVFGCIITLVASVYYEDCGGHGFVVESVEVEGCSTSPCLINVGTSVTVTVNSVNTDTSFAALLGEAYIVQLGYAWGLKVTPNDICLHWGGCPLSESATRKYSGDVYFNSTLLRRRGHLRLTAKYEDGNDFELAFCVRIPVNLI
ncbi:epididymal secretory protein E1-like [Anoplophora glabripennis]|uniref:epididymal secretory protein E1-like n=1 Tax=Anoplophora glabripennis TaxID=217634 RepID=UPI000874D2C2|nr:epididymal secretory protein E1-like [Anoplophora glabripennis]